jgi:hypothetical protein
LSQSYATGILGDHASKLARAIHPSVHCPSFACSAVSKPRLLIALPAFASAGCRSSTRGRCTTCAWLALLPVPVRGRSSTPALPSIAFAPSIDPIRPIEKTGTTRGSLFTSTECSCILQLRHHWQRGRGRHGRAAAALLLPRLRRAVQGALGWLGGAGEPRHRHGRRDLHNLEGAWGLRGHAAGGRELDDRQPATSAALVTATSSPDPEWARSQFGAAYGTAGVAL